jgi:CheY-like chemotaxis protein
MPRMDGFQATAAIRRRESENGLMRMPIIAMTANAMAGDRERCIEAGMDEYMAKPVKPATLETMLRQWLPMKEVTEDTEVAASAESEPLEPVVETQATKGEEKSEEDKVLDDSVLQELYEIMEDDFISVLQSYRENAPELIQRIQSSIESGDVEGMVSAAHSLKSSSANVGAMNLSAVSKQMEHNGRLNNLKDLEQLFDQLMAAYGHAIRELDRVIEGGGKARGYQPDARK